MLFILIMLGTVVSEDFLFNMVLLAQKKKKEEGRNEYKTSCGSLFMILKKYNLAKKTLATIDVRILRKKLQKQLNEFLLFISFQTLQRQKQNREKGKLRDIHFPGTNSLCQYCTEESQTGSIRSYDESLLGSDNVSKQIYF